MQATYSVFEKTGQKYFQIDTYGKSDREIPGKISQSFQLDKECAKFLVERLKKEFDL
ncbi:MAG: methionyl-tRNA formyltransferase [Clostridium sp.]